MDGPALRRALWISDYFPRPHDMTTGTWALESAVALQAAGLPVAVMSPTPWIPRLLAVNDTFRKWSRVPREHEIRGVPVHYVRCPHYPRRWVNNVLYNHVPLFDTGLLWPWCRHAAQRIISKHPFEVAHANFLFPSGFIGLKLKELYGTRLIVHERSVQRLAMARAHARRRGVYRWILRSADVVITENENMASDLMAVEPSIADLRVFKQPGMHPDLVQTLTRERPERYRGRLVVLSVGALSERKGHEFLIRSIAQLKPSFPNLVCRIIGAGSRRRALESLINDLGVTDSVELCGKKPHAEVLGEMSWCDVFALASWGEAGGTVYGEAMQFGKPIVACKGEGITDIARDEVHGRLVAARSVPELADALRWLLADAGRRESTGVRARELATAELSYATLARALIDLYREALCRAEKPVIAQPDRRQREGSRPS